MTTSGIDISNYQYGLDLAKAKAGGVEFAILKLSEGRTIADASFERFYDAATAAGLPVGAYVYSHALTPSDAITEADYALSLLGGKPLPLGLFMDVETYNQMSIPKQQLVDTCKAFCARVEAAGYISGLYGSEYNLWTMVNPADCGGTIVWVAHYGRQPDCPCDLWQSSDHGGVNGYNGPVDTDIVMSDRFLSLLSGAEPQPEPDPEPDPEPEPAQKSQPDVVLLQTAMFLDDAWDGPIDGINTPEWREAFREYAGIVLGINL